ncbi:hypothetical protein E3T33_03795 [Cryobacterium sp. TMT1-2-1]|uniref:hypothetical protein n=1 Tax=Cryobacterium sp. TMT1-2-1 TaxID=1259232 RepID=UPI00106A8DAE|nr:hypothetical protein [Cryobacterium sp. TMT1-2-1]TFD47158.1 hypothetical protein E3T33_03795 [Cryobacterium sp. TMT1-2-1]
MKVIGIKNGKDTFGWVIVEGNARADAAVLDFKELSAPLGDRAGQLAWLRRELIEVLARQGVDRASLRLAESGPSGAPNFGRAEMDGVAQATLAELNVPVKSFKSATVRSSFGKSKAVAEAAIELVPCVSASAKTRRDQLVVAVAQFAV